jgi:hypothetical protein
VANPTQADADHDGSATSATTVRLNNPGWLTPTTTVGDVCDPETGGTVTTTATVDDEGR